MKRKNKYVILLIIVFLVLFGIKMPTKADSGWDSSYDSGSSSSSDWGSSSDYGSSSSSDGEMTGLDWVILFSFFAVAILIANNNIIKSIKSQNNIDKIVDISEEEFKVIVKDSSMDKMKQKAFDIYKDIQYAWSNFDYDKLRFLTTDEIFNMYSSQLNTLEIKNQQNVMKDIIKEDVKIIDVKEENGIITIESYLKVNCYDYVIDKKTDKVLRGTDKNKLEIEYIITLVKDVNSDNDNITKCPSCGAEVEMKTRGKCPYCKSVLVQKPSDYVMSKKECIGQRKL